MACLYTGIARTVPELSSLLATPSCPALTETISTAGGDFEAASSISDYEYDQDAYDAGSCNLDKGSGAIHPTTGQYSYFLTAGYPYTPIYYYGEAGSSSLCSIHTSSQQ